MKKYNPKSLLNLKGAPKGSHRSPASEIKKGQRIAPKTEFKKGMVPWNKGKKGYKNKEYKNKGISFSNKGQFVKGYKQTKEEVEKRISKIRGEKHGNWKGGVTEENMKIRQSLEYVIWRNDVWRRDNWTCRVCEHKGKGIIAHHLKLFSEFPELRFSVENGITLCRKCHLEVHGGVSKIRWNKERDI